jgi:CubicO group peptidase (beta-lactamase class C family)
MMSVSKAVASICMHILVDRGEIDTTLPIATYWPEFAEAGKGDLPLRFVLDHRAGLPFLEPPLPQGAIYDAQTICQALARLAPMWEPGEEMGYHVMTQGFLVAEVVRRVAGMTLGNFFRQEVAEPLGLDYHIGLPPEHFTRCAGFILPADIPLRYAPANPETPEGRFWAQLAKGEDFNSNGWRSSEIPSANGHGNARATAKLYGVLVSSERLMSRETLQRMASEQHNMVEQFLGRHYHQGLGVVLNSPPVAWMGPNSKFFGHQGAGGSIGYGDPDARIGFSYAMNRMHMPDSGPRDALAKALFACLEG